MNAFRDVGPAIGSILALPGMTTLIGSGSMQGVMLPPDTTLPV